MPAEARIAKLEAMRAARVGPNGLAIKGYVRNVEKIDLELARLKRTGIAHPPKAITQQHDPKDKTRPRLTKQPPPRIAVKAPAPAAAAQPSIPVPTPVYRPPISDKGSAKS